MKILSLIGVALLTNFAISQTDAPQQIAPTNPTFCGSTEQTQLIYEQHPEYKIQDSIDQAQFQIDYESFLQNYSPDERVTYRVPVVVHVVHLGGPENISNEQIYDGIEKLNLDFSMTNPDGVNTVAAFQGLRANADIEFVLATKDPNGNCHSGITRTYSSTTYDTGLSNGSHPIVEAVQAEHGNWPQNKYMSIFICIDPSGAAGYTYRPANWYPATGMYGGIILRHDYMGTIGTAGSYAKHTLSHEAGHWMNLAHPWGSTNSPGDSGNCSDDDGVSDTPNTIGWSSCNLSGNSCGSDDNVQNIMEYSYCSTMFTTGQAARMQTAIQSNTADRNNLWTNANLVATGTDVPNTSVCQVDFSSTNTVVCAGSSIDFSDLSYFGVTNRTWSFNGGSPSNSSDSVATIVYNTPGVYDVTLQISDGTNSTSATSTNYITVLPNPGTPLPYTEGFENLTTFPDNYNYFIENDDNGQTWEITSTASSLGSKSLKLNNYGTTGGTEDRFVSGPIDLSVLDASENFLITFDYAYNKRNSADLEKLRIYVSKDCGDTWSLRKNIQGDNLNSQTSSSAYTPSDKSEWTTVTIDNVTSSYYVSNFRYKIQFEGDGGNNIYIDNINLYPESWLSTTENSVENSISVYPNPTANSSTINYFSTGNDNVNISLFNVIGEKVVDVYSGAVNTGNNQFEINLENLPKGIYIVKISDSTGIHTVKLIKE